MRLIQVLRLFSYIVGMLFFTLCSGLGVMILIFDNSLVIKVFGFLMFLIFVVLNVITYNVTFKEES